MCVLSKTLSHFKRLQMGFLVSHRKRLEPRALPWQQHSRCHSVSFAMYILGSKFEQHCSNRVPKWWCHKNIFFWNYGIWRHILLKDPKWCPHTKNKLWIAILDGDIRDQSLIASHTNPSKVVLVPSVWNQLKIREIYMGQYQTFILYISAGNYN